MKTLQCERRMEWIDESSRSLGHKKLPRFRMLSVGG